MKLVLAYLKRKPRFIEYMYQHSLSKNYNYFIFILTVGVTLFLKQTYFILLYIHEDLINTNPLTDYYFVLRAIDHPVKLVVFFLALGWFLGTIAFFFMGSWHILKIIYFPEYFRNKKRNKVIIKKRKRNNKKKIIK